MIGLDRTANILSALPTSNFSWPPGDESAPLSSALPSMTTANSMARHTNRGDPNSPRHQSSLTPAPESSSPHSRTVGKSPGNESENGRNTGLGDEGGMPSPLSELSAPEDEEEDADEKEGKADSKSEESRQAGALNASLHTNGVSKKHGIASNAEASSSSSPLRGSHPHLVNSTGSAPRLPNPNAQKRNRKVDILVHLNGELFKALDEFRSRSIGNEDSRYTEYNGRLQMNLSWLANAADSPQPLVAPRNLPPLFTPPAVEFVQMERIVQLYRDLGAAFAKDVARVREGASHVSPQSAQMPPGSLKRERTEHATPEPMNKRRDTGEHKTPMLPPSTPIPIGRGFPPGVAPGTPQMVGSSPSIPQQGFNNPNQAEMSRRAVQLQQREREQMMRAQQASQQQRPNQASPNQMQPPPVPGMGPGAGVPAGGPPNNAQVQAILNQFGQNGLTAMKLLQSPNHPAMQQILKNIPAFFNQPLPMQITSVLRYMSAMERQQQQQPQQNAGGGMQMQGGPGGIPLNRMGSGTQPGASMGVPSQNNMSQPLPPGSGIGGLTQSQLMTLRPEQRQMLLMQQQQRMGGGPGGGMPGGMQGGVNSPAFGGAGQGQGGINPAAFGGAGAQGGINPAMLQQQQQQQQHRLMQQQAAQQQYGGSMGSPVHSSPPAGGDFAGMHQRGTHSPSENAPSPMTPRGGPGSASDFQRVMAMQAAQANASSPAPGSGGGFINPQQMMAGGGGGGGWPPPQQNHSNPGGPYGGTPPGSAHGRPQQQYAPSASSPSAGSWPGSGGVGGFPYAPSPVNQMGGPHQQQRPPSRTASAAGGFPGMDPSGGGSPAPGGGSAGMGDGMGDFSDFLNIQGW